MLERARRPGEVDPGQPRIRKCHIGNRDAVAGEQVDHTRRQTRGLQQLHGQVGGERLRRRRLPHHRVAHQRGRGRQVARDRGEVERRDRVDEALQRPVVGAVPHPAGADRLLRQDLPCEADVEPPEVDQLARPRRSRPDRRSSTGRAWLRRRSSPATARPAGRRRAGTPRRARRTGWPPRRPWRRSPPRWRRSRRRARRW